MTDLESEVGRLQAEILRLQDDLRVVNERLAYAWQDNIKLRSELLALRRTPIAPTAEPGYPTPPLDGAAAVPADELARILAQLARVRPLLLPALRR